MQTATARSSHLKLLPDPSYKLQSSASAINSAVSTDKPQVQYMINKVSYSARTKAEVHAYHVRGEGAITRSSLLSAVQGIDLPYRAHYKDVIGQVTRESGSWPIANSAYIVFHAETDPMSSINEGKQLVPLMSLVKDLYGKHDSLMLMSVVLREIGPVDVHTV